ncbi:hypothetical protein VTN77DRAFT_7967 [Rasamsonia byssochlamydoides]|uniref:uncharacterized protein n=1 Tax=Rasamsonia byssochlamydoides TaxID=89139 RepID=UPI0037423611
MASSTSSIQPAPHNPLSKKRRFQPPITNFFASAGSVASDGDDQQNAGLSYTNYSSPTHTPTPVLPAKVQASLLTVGMRIRKSVPEGYKTEQKKLTEYTVSNAVNSETPGAVYTQTRTCYAELEPFCGIHKIGNFAVQTFPRPAEEYRDRRMQMSHDSDMSSVPSSTQESHASSVFSANSNKRSYDSDVEDVDENGDNRLTTEIHSSAFCRGSLTAGGIWQDPLRLNPVTETSPTAPSRSQRTILSPKLGQQRRQFSSFQSHLKRSPGQENKDPVSVRNDVDMDDFEEASFLRRREEVDADYTWDGGVEVEMAG